jgi:hypothetical protein
MASTCPFSCFSGNPIFGVIAANPCLSVTRGISRGMATAQHRARFPDTVPSPRDRESREDFSGEKKSGEESEEGKPSELLLVRRGLPSEVKRFIVESFACFQTHKTVQDEVARRFGIVLDGRTLLVYDPARPQCRIGPRLRLLYDECRKAYIEGVQEVAISHQAHRLRLLSRVVEKATTSKDYANAIKGLELAAKEMGGALSGQHTIRHEGTIGHVHATVEEAKAEIASRLTMVLEAGTLLSAPSVATPPATPPAPSTEEGGA